MGSKKNYTIVISLLSSALLFIILLSLPSPPVKETKLNDFPKIIGNWVGEDRPIEEKVYEILSESDLLLRVYKNAEGKKVSLFIVASSTNLEAFHPPEICFQGTDAQFLKKEIVEIQPQDKKIKITKLYIKQSNQEELVIYWFRVGNKTIPTYYLHQLNMVIDQILLKKSISSMILLTAPIENKNIDSAFELEKSFIKEIAPLLDKYCSAS